MKLTAFLILSLLAFVSCKNQPDQFSEAKATMVSLVEKPALEYRMGFDDRTIKLGKVVPYLNSHTVYFTNHSDSPLYIDDVFSKSEHIDIHSFTYEIAPGAQGKIKFRIDHTVEKETYSDFLYVLENSVEPSEPLILELDYEFTEELVIGGQFVEDGDRINVRMFPNLEATVLFGLDPGDEVICKGAMFRDYVEQFDSNLWYYVEYKGRKGWVLSVLTDIKQLESGV